MTKSRYNKLIMLLLAALVMTGCVSKENPEKQVTFERSGFLLGTVISIKLQEGGSEELLDEIFLRVEEIENLMSTSIEGSDVDLINKAAGKGTVEVSKDTLTVIQKALEYSKLSNGYFDITLGPLINLWKIGTPEARIPEDKEIEEALALIDYNKVIIDGQSVGLEEEDMKMDLGGIAKGYAADIISNMAKEAGVTSGIINLGGNVKVINSKPDGSPYKIGIQNPLSSRNNYLGVVKVIDQTVVTSGDYERFFEVDGKRYHHIFNKDTGYPTDNSIGAVTVITNNSIDADALSTILYILGKKAGIKLVNSLDDVECIYITKDKELYLSDGMIDIYTITDDSFKIID